MNRSSNDIVSKRIDNLRIKLLDLTRRNPLISTKFSEKSNSLIRVIDEVPDMILESIISHEMKISSLPDLNINPKDENTQIFHNTFTEARLNDEIYLKRIEEIDENDSDASSLFSQSERQLKDRIREKLKLPPRQTKRNLSLQQHAKNHDISPQYELPNQTQAHKDGRHSDKNIQTLLLPDVLERRLNSLYSKEKSWKEEAGISVLHIAFGFLEWQDGNNSSNQFSPLLLLPVQIEKKRTKQGYEFWISSEEDEVKENKILAEKLRLELGIILPEYNGQGLEAYFKEVVDQNPNNITWNLKRFVAIGVFPSARLAMYHDLNPEYDFGSHDIVSTILGGSNLGQDNTPFGDEYEIDEPEIEVKVPCLITDADCSQFSTIVDISDGKNLAVEGPPGTGKSQTIVNTIANMLAKGKKVLFVAEKSAALEVVRSRLESFGLGEFLLPLQANRSSKEQVISSIRNRVEMRPCENIAELSSAFKKFKEARQEIKLYIDILSSKYGKTNFIIHEILGRSIKYSKLINGLPEEIKNLPLPNLENLNSDELEDILSICKEIENSHEKILNYNSYWKYSKIPNIDPFKANEILELAKNVSNKFYVSYNCRKELEEFGINIDTNIEKLSKIDSAINDISDNLSNNLLEILKRIDSIEKINSVKNYLKNLNLWLKDRDAVMENISLELDKVSLSKLRNIKAIAEKYNLDSIKDDELDLAINKIQTQLDDYNSIIRLYQDAEKIQKKIKKIDSHNFVKISDLIYKFSRESLSLRKEELNDPSIQLILSRQARKLDTLKKEREFLEKEFYLNLILESENINNHISILTTSGIFSFLSSNYRATKKFYFSISRNKIFKKEKVVTDLKKLLKWQSDLKDFCNNEALKKVISLHFDGIETNLTPFEDAICFLQELEDIALFKNCGELKKFLQFGDLNDLRDCFEINFDHPIRKIEKITFEELDKKAIDTKKLLKECRDEISFIKNEKNNLFVNSDKLLRNEILRIPELINKLLEDRNYLRQGSVISNILGCSFQAEKSDPKELEQIIKTSLILKDIEEENRNAIFYCLKDKKISNLKDEIQKVIISDQDAFKSLEKIVEQIDANQTNLIQNRNHKDFADILDLASQDRDGLMSYSRFVGTKNKLQNYGYKSIIEKIFEEGFKNITQIMESLIMRNMAQKVYQIHGDKLSFYNGSNLNALKEKFQKADKEVIKLSRRRLRSKLYNNSAPPLGNGCGRKSEYTELSLLKNEISKKKRHIPVRKLTQRAGKALLELKPCWMMSPLAVSQYLEKDNIIFDLVIIDEASQMTPEDSIGALVRSRQAMIVGDTNQLPPTGFFRKVLDDEDADEDEKTTEESILEMANYSFKPARRLRWHYRSKSASLISFSNKYVYDNDLVVFPSANERNPDMGVYFVKVNGLYSSGINPKESEAMVDAIITFMKQNKHKSLGVVLLNQKQRDLIFDEFNYAIKEYPDVKNYIEHWEGKNDGLESFFIKNLENVQGDERDVIFIGTVYGPEKEGLPVMQRFGPINGISGKRRLNVLFSRAKERIVTFSSMLSSDIKAEEDGNVGAYILKCWLEYSNSGIIEKGIYSNKEPDSAFEEHVINQIKSIGCEAIPQVGVKGYSIDIGVKHPDWPHGFIMGIECDGASYHSSKSARDRDRLRQEILENLGWYIYRIWSTDWFEDPIKETEKLRNEIQNRLSLLKNNDKKLY